MVEEIAKHWSAPFDAATVPPGERASAIGVRGMNWQAEELPCLSLSPAGLADGFGEGDRLLLAAFRLEIHPRLRFPRSACADSATQL